VTELREILETHRLALDTKRTRLLEFIRGARSRTKDVDGERALDRLQAIADGLELDVQTVTKLIDALDSASPAP
jgi:hypothetical protein